MFSGLYKHIYAKRKYLLMYLIIFIAYYAVVLLIHPLKYDFFDEFYPKRYFLTHNLRNGIIPFWCPYQHAGFPFYADPSGAFFYPLTWIISIFTDYTLVVGHFEFIFHLCIAATGFYKLSSLFVKDQNICSMLALSYALGGFFTGNAQHYPWIISVSWMPFVFYGFLNMVHQNNLVWLLKTSVYIMLFVTGGYPAFAFIAAYCFLIIIIYKIYIHIKQRESDKIRQIIKKVSLLSAIVIVLCIGYISSMYFVSQYISRGEELSLSQALEHPFSPKAMISFILPFVSVKSPIEIFNADMSVTSGYMGLLCFIFFLTSFTLVKNRKYLFLIFSTLVLLFISFGEGFFLREFLFDYVPFMNLFRFPSLFRIFFISGALLLAGISLEYYSSNPASLKKISFIPLALFLLLIISVVFIRLNGYIGILKFVQHDLLKQSPESTFAQHFVFQAGVQCIFLFSLFIVLRFFNHIRRLTVWLLIMVSFDMILAFWLNAPYTVYYDSFRMKKVIEYEKSFPRDYPYPSRETLINTLNTDFSYGPYWQNLPTFFKQVSAEGRNPFKLKEFLWLRTDYPVLFDSTLNNKVVWLSSSVFPYDSIETHIKEGRIHNKFVYLKLVNPELKNRIGTFLNYDPEVIDFLPDKMTFSIKTNKPGYLVFLQNYYPGWKATINKQPVNIEKVNLSFMAVYLSPGNSSIEFSFKRPLEKTWLFLSFGVLIILIICIYIMNRKQRMEKS